MKAADASTSGKQGMPFPPPVMYIAALLTGIGLDAMLPLSLPLSSWRIPAGLFCLSLAIPVVVTVLCRFRRAGTTFDVGKEASALVVDGPFRISRHPAYVALTLAYIGLALVLNSGWGLILLAPVLIAMDRWLLPKEEKWLETIFGEQYRRYCSTVRRWL